MVSSGHLRNTVADRLEKFRKPDLAFLARRSTIITMQPKVFERDKRSAIYPQYRNGNSIELYRPYCLIMAFADDAANEFKKFLEK